MKMSQNSVFYPWWLMQLSSLAGLPDAVNGVHFITLGFRKTNMKPLSSLCFSDISYSKQKSWSSLTDLALLYELFHRYVSITVLKFRLL